MKRNMKLILKILRWTEEHGNTHPLDPPDFQDIPTEQVRYHVQLCYEAGFLHLSNNDSNNPKYRRDRLCVLGLTWNGNEFLDQNRD